MQAQTTRENTQLEAHLYDLKGLHEALSNAVNRASRLADRLLGAEPANIQGAGTPGLKEPMEPPLLTRLNSASQIAKELSQQIDYHLNRLDRL